MERPCHGDRLNLPKGNVCGECVNCLINEATETIQLAFDQEHARAERLRDQLKDWAYGADTRLLSMIAVSVLETDKLKAKLQALEAQLKQVKEALGKIEGRALEAVKSDCQCGADDWPNESVGECWWHEVLRLAALSDNAELKECCIDCGGRGKMWKPDGEGMAPDGWFFCTRCNGTGHAELKGEM